MTVDWVATGSMLTGLGTIAGAASIAWAALIGRSRFDEWRRRGTEKRRIDVAESVLLAAIECQTAYSEVRSIKQNPLAWKAGELRARKERDPMDQSELRRAEIAGWDRVQRMLDQSPKFEKLQSLRPLALAYFGENLDQLIQDLICVRTEIVQAGAYYDQATQGESDRSPMKLEAILWEQFPCADPTQDKLDRIHQGFEDLLLPILRTDGEGYT